MKKFIFFLFLSITSYAQTTFSYLELKKYVDGTQGEFTVAIKAKGFTYSSSEDSYVSYKKDHSSLIFTKFSSGRSGLTLYGKKYEYISNNILNSVKKIGYKEIESQNIDGLGFCTTYKSTNYTIYFCDNIIEYDNGSTEPIYMVTMDKNENLE
ncbi:hypothetical protein OBJ68_09705 [Empedobacter falsenii]